MNNRRAQEEELEKLKREFDDQYGEMEFDGGGVDLDELLGNLTGLSGSSQNRGYDNNDDDFDVDELLNEDDIDQFIGSAQENQDEFDDALPPLEDMLLLIDDKAVHAAYNYNPNTRQRGGFNNRSNQSSPYAQSNDFGGNSRDFNTEYPPLDQTTWKVDDCERLVAYLKKQLMAILQYALSVKKLDLRNAPQYETEAIFKNAANTLKEVKDLIACIARIDTQDFDHLSIQSSVFGLSDTMVKSTVTMLKTAMNVSKGQANMNQFNDVYNPFFTNAKNLIGLVNTLNFGQWGRNEIFFA